MAKSDAAWDEPKHLNAILANAKFKHYVSSVERTDGGPGYWEICDRRGRITIVPDPMLRDSEDRTDVVLAAIDESEYSAINFTLQRWPRIHWLRGSAILAGTVQPIAPAFSITPGDTPGQGVGETVQGEQLALSQSALNAATAMRVSTRPPAWCA
jgi:hypothetical protein